MAAKNIRLIFDRDHGPENEGWYTRHDEYRHGELVNPSVDESLGEDSDYPLTAAIEDTCERFGCSEEEITLIG